MRNEHPGRAHQIVQSLEAKEMKRRPLSLKVADYLTTSFGSISFFVVNAVFFGFWILINAGKIPPIPVFDPYPFNLLTMAVSLEAIFLSIIVLMSQNRQSFISSLREELDMNVDLIAEREITKTLKLVSRLLKEKGVEIKDEELAEMLKEIDASYIERELERELGEKSATLIEKVEKTITNLSS